MAQMEEHVTLDFGVDFGVYHVGYRGDLKTKSKSKSI